MRFNKEEICQNCKFRFLNGGAGWCKDKKDWTARKATCNNFERKQK